MPDAHDHPDDRAVEAALIERARNGCCESFGKIVELHQDRLYNFLLRRLRHPHKAEEAAQAALVRAWMNLSRYDSTWRFSTWLYTIALRGAADLERSVRREAGGHQLALARGREDDPAEAIGRSDECRAVWALADDVLEADERVALWLRYGDDAPIEQIAHVLGRTRGATRVMLHRARKRLAEAWNERRGHRETGSSQSEQPGRNSSRSAPQLRAAPCTGADR